MVREFGDGFRPDMIGDHMYSTVETLVRQSFPDPLIMQDRVWWEHEGVQQPVDMFVSLMAGNSATSAVQLSLQPCLGEPRIQAAGDAIAAVAYNGNGHVTELTLGRSTPLTDRENPFFIQAEQLFTPRGAPTGNFLYKEWSQNDNGSWDMLTVKADDGPKTFRTGGRELELDFTGINDCVRLSLSEKRTGMKKTIESRYLIDVDELLDTRTPTYMTADAVRRIRRILKAGSDYTLGQEPARIPEGVDSFLGERTLQPA